ncbi:hypothetical protein D3C83_134190 [compost metagenome]
MEPRRRVGIDNRQQFVERRRVLLLESIEHFLLALQAMRDEPPRLLVRRFDDVPVSRRDRRDIQREQTLERREVSLHVAVRRRDHDR